MSDYNSFLSEFIESAVYSQGIQRMDPSILSVSITNAVHKLEGVDKPLEIASKIKGMNPELYNNVAAYAQKKYNISTETMKMINHIDLSDINGMFPHVDRLMNQREVKKTHDPKKERRLNDIKLTNERVRLMQEELNKSETISLQPVIYTCHKQEEITLVSSIECNICHKNVEIKFNRIIVKCIGGCLLNCHQKCWNENNQECVKCGNYLKKIQNLENGKFISHRNFELPVAAKTEYIIECEVNTITEPERDTITKEVNYIPKCPGWKDEDVHEYEQQVEKHKNEILKLKEKVRAKHIKKNKQRRPKVVDINYNIKGQKQPILNVKSPEYTRQPTLTQPSLNSKSPEYIPQQSITQQLLNSNSTQYIPQQQSSNIFPIEYISVILLVPYQMAYIRR